MVLQNHLCYFRVSIMVDPVVEHSTLDGVPLGTYLRGELQDPPWLIESSLYRVNQSSREPATRRSFVISVMGSTVS